MDNQNIQVLQRMLASAENIKGTDIDKKPIAASIKASIKDILENHDEAKARELVMASYQDPEKALALNAARMIQVGTYLLPTLHFGRSFQIETLGRDEQAFLYNNTKTHVKFSYIGNGNEPLMVNIDPAQGSFFVNLKLLASERVRYPLFDVQRGDISQLSRNLFDLAYDLSSQIDYMCYTLLTAGVATGTGGAFGAFTTTGADTAKSYVADPRVLSAHLPTTNDVTVSGVTTFGFPVLRAIVDYCNRWGNSFADGPLRPTGEVIVPASDIANIGDTITTVTTANNNNIAESVRADGYQTSVHYLGITWTFIPNNTIPSGTCYPIFNKTVGTMFLKPFFDGEFTEKSEKYNWEERWVRKAIGMAIPDTRRVNTARFTYGTA